MFVTKFVFLGLIEISKALQTKSIIILAPLHFNYTIDMNGFLSEVYRSNMQTYIFTDISKYLQFIRRCQDESVSTSSLIFASPDGLLPIVKKHKLNKNQSE